MPGVLLGSVVLIATWVLVQDGTSGRVQGASNVGVAMLRRLMSPAAAGLGDHSRPRPDQSINNNAGGGGRPPTYY